MFIWLRPILIRSVKSANSLQLGRILRRRILRVWSFLLFPEQRVSFQGFPTILRPENVEVGMGCSINHGVFIQGRNRVIIGNYVTLSPYVMLLDAGLKLSDIDLGQIGKAHDSNPITIGDHVWIGAGAIILPGVTIGERSIVAAGAVVVQNIPPHTCVAGVPARPVVRKDL
jgi:acetyltransferase-like isoleucine patch superfamily enzyme